MTAAGLMEEVFWRGGDVSNKAGVTPRLLLAASPFYNLRAIMDLRLLEIFCAVYEEGGISKAAERLHLTQPTVSGHIKTLEEYFGTPLFDRLGRGIQPTRAGDLLYEYGRRIVEIKKNIAEGMGKFLNRLAGRIVIGASTIPGEYLLPPLVGRFHRAHPQVEISLMISDTAQVIHQVTRGHVDVGCVGAQWDSSDLEFTRFASDRLILIAPSAKRWEKVRYVSLEELVRLPLVLREPGSGTRAVFQRALREHGYHLEDFHIVAQLGSTTAIKQAVMAGLGLSVISHRAVRHELRCRLLRSIPIRDLPSLRRDFFFVRDPRRTLSPLGEMFLEFALARRGRR